MLLYSRSSGSTGREPVATVTRCSQGVLQSHQRRVPCKLPYMNILELHMISPPLPLSAVLWQGVSV